MWSGALALIKNKEGHILLQHRDGNAPTNPNVWGLWGGEIDPGETSVQAAIRELKEELDINVEASQLHFFKKQVDENWEADVFLLKDEGGFVYHLQEGDDLKFFAPEELMDLKTDSRAHAILEDYLKASKSF